MQQHQQWDERRPTRSLQRASFSVGAISASTNVLASFSSRGPSLFYTPNLLKPNISAPGVSVRSVTNASDTGYTTASGTSMAGPHVAGVVALLWSARPQLVRNIAATKAIFAEHGQPGGHGQPGADLRRHDFDPDTQQLLRLRARRRAGRGQRRADGCAGHDQRPDHNARRSTVGWV